MAGIAALAIAYTLSQFFRSFLAVLAPRLIADISVSEADLSTAAGIWFIAFALMQFPVGYALDRHGPKRTAASLLLLAAAGATLFARADGAIAITVAMALIGAGCSALLMASLFIFAKTYPPRRFAMLSSWLVAFGLAGGVLGSAPLALAVEAFGWRTVMVGLAVITVAASLGILAFVRDPEPGVSAAGGDVAGGGFLALLKTRQLWPMMIMAGVAYAPAANLRGLWAGPFLADVHGMDTGAIGNATFFMALALIAGSIAYGPLDLVFKTRKWVALVGSALTACTLAALALFGAQSAFAAVMLLTAAAFFGANYSMIMAHARSFFPPHLVGRGVTLMNFFSMGGAGTVQFASGRIFATASDASPGAPAYAILFGFYGLLLAAGLAIYVFSRERHPADTPAAA